MFGDLLLTGARLGVTVFGAVAVFISMAAVLFLILYSIIGMIAGESKDDKKTSR